METHVGVYGSVLFAHCIVIEKQFVFVVDYQEIYAAHSMETYIKTVRLSRGLFVKSRDSTIILNRLLIYNTNG